VVLVAVLYVAAFLAWFFGLAANNNAPPALGIVLFLAGNLGFGLWIGKVWIIALPLVIPLVSLPVANVQLFDDGGGTFLDFAVLLALIAAAAIFAGLAVRWLGWPRSKLP
jgi:hypothetical protein